MSVLVGHKSKMTSIPPLLSNTDLVLYQCAIYWWSGNACMYMYTYKYIIIQMGQIFTITLLYMCMYSILILLNTHFA